MMQIIPAPMATMAIPMGPMGTMGTMGPVQGAMPVGIHGIQCQVLVPVAMVSFPVSPAPSTVASTSVGSETGSEGMISRQSSELVSETDGTPASPEQRDVAANLTGGSGIFGCVWDLSQRSKGCRHVQEMLQSCGDLERSQLSLELKGHVWQAARSACANYVLQKFIQVLRPQACQFIIDELLQQKNEVTDLARHQYGCRILQRLLENCHVEQMEPVVKLLLSEAMTLVRHSYGTFVMQVIFDFGTEEQREQLGITLLEALKSSSQDENCAQVLSKALQHAPQKETLATAMVPHLPQLARGRHSHHTVLPVLQLLPEAELNRAMTLLSQKATKLWASRYGRLVVKAIPSLYLQCCSLTRREAAVSSRN